MCRSVVDRSCAVSYLRRRGMLAQNGEGLGELLIERTARSAEEPRQRVLVHNICHLYVSSAIVLALIRLIYAVFEIVSAYGTVGLSLGAPSVGSSSEFTSLAFPLLMALFVLKIKLEKLLPRRCDE